MQFRMNAIQTDGHAPQFGQTVREFSPKNVWLKVAYAGLCRTDVLCGEGKLNVKPNRIIGHECSGLVIHSPDSRFKIGARVTVNPFLSCGECSGCHSDLACEQGRLIGRDRDGAFAEYVELPSAAVYPISNDLSLQKAAFAEPVAAALSILNLGLVPDMTGLVIGEGRIARLTLELLQIHGFRHVTCIKGADFKKKVDFVVDTRTTFDLEAGLQLLKPKGIFVLKSRRPLQTKLPVSLIVQRELQIKGAFYGDFAQAVDLLERGVLDTHRYFGPVHSLGHFVSHFYADESKKQFCQPHRYPEEL